MGIVREGDWIINRKGLMRKVVTVDQYGKLRTEHGDPASEEHNWPATLEDAFRLAKLPKPKGSIIAQVFGELVALRNDGVEFKDQQVFTKFKIRTISTGTGPLTVWHEDGTFGRLHVIDLSRLPLSDAESILPECVLACLNPPAPEHPAPPEPTRAGASVERSGTSPQAQNEGLEAFKGE